MDVIVTLGNEMRGDDAAGIMFGRLIEGLEGVEVIEGREAPENVTGLIEHHRPKRILIADAFDFGGNPGEVVCVPGDRLDGPDISTHASLTLFIDYLRITTNAEIFVLGFQPKTTGFNVTVSDEVNDSVCETARKVLKSGSITGIITGVTMYNK